MKVKRQKHVRKVLMFYKNNFGLKPLYNVLVDGTFCKAALTFKVNISEQLPKYLEAETNIYTTSCILAECEAFGSVLYGPLKVLRQFRVFNCHHKRSLPAANCVHSVIMKSEKKFMVATQDQDLQKRVRQVKGVPSLYIAFNAINIESPSKTSQRSADKDLESRIAPSEHAKSVLKQLKLETFGETEVVRKKKKKGPKGPNPLSCQKKKKVVAESAVTSRKKRHRRRKRTKVQHVKDYLATVPNS